ncbi:tRNA lysidine(34) synthetase TilS [Sphingomonas bacterium]|uniref:tRNA lysidine(34) synthetase TilS n=1 Tax=Sphingomonas bacterium TaxID=1895847 RepID=UPI002624C960|nr:tRNA lysidine(34) synthetase TilS [Sphingomonas bacterium]MDB5679908.1 tRNA lysidine(34) synthetase TilS [Sphingomonas bacterium]
MPPTSANELSRAAVARFARDLAALAEPNARVLVAVSGGPDSLALLLLAHAALGDRCHAATVDHGLRPEAADEAAWIADLCATRGIDHAILRAPLPDRAGRTANLSARARALRYRLLERHADAIGADLIATAHHADDQLETLIMRLNRGAGLAGLAGVRVRGGRIIRPLLGWRHAELVALVAEQGIAAIDDPSNVSDRFDRARLRKALAGIDWLDVDRVGASAAALGDAEDAIAWMVRRLEAELCLHEADGSTLRIDDVPFELRRRLLERCVARFDPGAELRGGAVADAVRTLDSKRSTMLGNVLCEPRGPEWRFSPAPPRRTP